MKEIMRWQNEIPRNRLVSHIDSDVKLYEELRPRVYKQKIAECNNNNAIKYQPFNSFSQSPYPAVMAATIEQSNAPWFYYHIPATPGRRRVR